MNLLYVEEILSMEIEYQLKNVYYENNKLSFGKIFSSNFAGYICINNNIYVYKHLKSRPGGPQTLVCFKYVSLRAREILNMTTLQATRQSGGINVKHIVIVIRVVLKIAFVNK